MTTPAEAMSVIGIVQACHPRSAPRMDDLEAMKALATVWAELFTANQLTLDQLMEAVKYRAQGCPDAPEPADIIRVARSLRQDRLARDPQPLPLPLPLPAIQPPPPQRVSFDVPPVPDASQYSHLDNRSQRLIAAQDAMGWCRGREESRAAIREYQAALAEYRGKPLTVHEAPLSEVVDVAAVLPVPTHVPDPGEPRHPNTIGDW